MNTRRFLEILPGFASWSALIAPVVASFFWPVGVAAFIIFFDTYWLYKSLLMGGHLVGGYLNMKRDIRIDWEKKYKNVPLEGANLDWRSVYNAIIFTTYKESYETLASSIQSLLDANFPDKKMILVLATEERDKENAQKIANGLKVRFGDKFFEFLVTEHPADLPGEVKGKGANASWAAKKLRQFLDYKGIDYENVIVSTADADTRFHQKYFDCLIYKYITEPNRVQRSFQPIPLYSNNIWYTPALNRVVAFGSSFWQMVEATRPWRLINFSTHAMSMKTLVEINYWAKDVVNEDSRQFWRAYFTFEGDHKVVPLFTPVSMDAVLAENYWATLKEQYLQKRRWAYGIEHFSYVVKECIKHKEIPLWDRMAKTYRLFEANFSWATASLYIMFVAWLPFIFAPDFRGSVVAYNVPFLARWLLSLTWIGLAISMALSILLLPQRPKHLRKFKYLENVLQWILVPISSLFFGSFPALDAQTHLMLGKYLTFRVTKKKVT